jgi:hypothetical protein
MNNQLLDLDESFGQWLHEGMKPIQTFIQRGGEELLLYTFIVRRLSWDSSRFVVE